MVAMIYCSGPGGGARCIQEQQPRQQVPQVAKGMCGACYKKTQRLNAQCRGPGIGLACTTPQEKVIEKKGWMCLSCYERSPLRRSCANSATGDCLNQGEKILPFKGTDLCRACYLAKCCSNKSCEYANKPVRIQGRGMCGKCYRRYLRSRDRADGIGDQRHSEENDYTDAVHSQSTRVPSHSNEALRASNKQPQDSGIISAYEAHGYQPTQSNAGTADQTSLQPSNTQSFASGSQSSGQAYHSHNSPSYTGAGYQSSGPPYQSFTFQGHASGSINAAANSAQLGIRRPRNDPLEGSESPPDPPRPPRRRIRTAPTEIGGPSDTRFASLQAPSISRVGTPSQAGQSSGNAQRAPEKRATTPARTTGNDCNSRTPPDDGFSMHRRYMEGKPPIIPAQTQSTLELPTMRGDYDHATSPQSSPAHQPYQGSYLDAIDSVGIPLKERDPSPPRYLDAIYNASIPVKKNDRHVQRVAIPDQNRIHQNALRDIEGKTRKMSIKPGLQKQAATAPFPKDNKSLRAARAMTPPPTIPYKSSVPYKSPATLPAANSSRSSTPVPSSRTGKLPAPKSSTSSLTSFPSTRLSNPTAKLPTTNSVTGKFTMPALQSTTTATAQSPKPSITTRPAGSGTPPRSRPSTPALSGKAISTSSKATSTPSFNPASSSITKPTSSSTTKPLTSPSIKPTTTARKPTLAAPKRSTTTTTLASSSTRPPTTTPTNTGARTGATKDPKKDSTAAKKKKR